jgi:N-ethylmaleimide reductase
VPEDFRRRLRAAYPGKLIVAGRYDAPRGDAMLAAGLADLIGFGRPFVANPDLPVRIRDGLAMVAFDPATPFGGDARGYTDYPPASPAR